MKSRNNRNDKCKQSGMITVEAVLCLIPFMLLILGIISLINVFIVHNRIQYALYGAGSELGSYTYIYEALGIHSADKKLNEDIGTNTKPVDKAISQVSDFMGEISSLQGDVEKLNDDDADIYETIKSICNDGNKTYKTSKEILETGKKFAKDPKSLLRGVVYLGIENVEQAGKNLLLQVMVSGLADKYLAEAAGNKTADQYLLGYDVKDGMNGLDFGESEFFKGAGNSIKIVVEYDIKLYFWGLFLKDNSLHVVQRVDIPAWLDGDGKSYKKK